MKYCRDCELGDCAMRTPLGGCAFDTPWFTSQPHWTLEQVQKYREELEGWDWEKFRREAAKDFMCALIMTDKNRGSFAQIRCEDNARTAIMYADELIRQLKEEKK